MTALAAINGELLLVKVGDGAGPEVFGAKCMINAERSMEFNANVQQEEVPDCTTPGAPAWQSAEVTGLTAPITGNGMVDKTDFAFWFNWWKSGAAKNVRWGPVDAASGYFSGAYKIANFKFTGNRKQKATFDVSLVSDGEITFTANT